MPTQVGSSGVVSLVVFTDINAVGEVWKDFQQHADCTVFQAFDWLRQWQHHVGVHWNSIPVIVLGLDRGKQPLFVLPLAIEKRGSVRRLTWLGSELCDYNAPLLIANFSDRVTPDDFGSLWQSVISVIRAESRLQFDVVELDRMPEKVESQKNPFLDLPVMSRTYGGHVATLGKDWNGFFLSKRSGETRKRERRQFKHLAEHGEVRFVDVRTRDDIDRTLKLLIEQKASSYARMRVENIFARPGYLDFFRAIVADPNLRDVIHLSRIDVGETPVATGLGLRFKGRYYLILSSYQDGALARFGPGRAHLQEMMRYAIEHRFDRFDFTIGDEPYKRDWCDVDIKLFGYVEAATMRGQCVAAMKTTVHRAEHFVTSRPALRRVAKGVAAVLALTVD
jgi:CelD/BcsL family acetyltransferase involved in cellulose biosynthesis